MKVEIYRYLFLAFGSMELISNAIYLVKENGIALARKQHQEIPARATDAQMRRKVLCMLVAGIVFFAIGLTSAVTRAFSVAAFAGALGAYAVFALGEAIYYRFWRPLGAFGLATVLFLVLVL